MGFTFRRRLWIVAVIFIFAWWGQQIEASGSNDFTNLLLTSLSTYITCVILFKLIVRRWILKGIRSEEEMRKAMKFGWVRKYIGAE